MSNLLGDIGGVVIQVVVILVGVALTFFAKKGQEYLDQAKQKDKLGIIDSITDRVVELVEVEFKGEKGAAKRDAAVNMAVKLLGEHGITISHDQVLTEIENGVNKLKQIQAGQGADLGDINWLDGIEVPSLENN